MELKANILLVEASKDWVELIRQILKSCSVKATYSVEQALDTLNDNKFDCLVLNLNLPNHNGIELLNERAGYRDLLLTPAIVYSTWPEIVSVNTDVWQAYSVSAWLRQSELTKLPGKIAEVLENAPNHY